MEPIITFFMGDFLQPALRLITGGISRVYILVGGLEHFLFSHILGIIIPIDHFSEGFKPPTRS